MIPVIASRPDGLGTRLLTILHALGFAERMGTSLTLGWPSLAHDHYDPASSLLKAETVGEIFEGGIPIRDRPDILIGGEKPWADKRTLCLHGALDQMRGMTAEEIEEFASQYDVMLYDLPFPLPLAGSNEAREGALVRDNWTRLNIAQPVQDAFDTISREIGLAQGVAAHIRRGDMLPMLRNAHVSDLREWGITQLFQRFVPLKTVANIVETRMPDAKSLVICSEDPSIVDQMQALLPDRTIFSSRGIFPSDGNQAALLDLMLLAGAQQLISPFKSYFSECANTVGRCELVNAGLDIPNLIGELEEALKRSECADKDARKAVLYMAGYLNLWHVPESEYRAWLLAEARAADPAIVDEMLGTTPAGADG